MTYGYRARLLPLLFLFAFTSALPEDAVAQLLTGKEFVVGLPSFWRQIDGGNPGNFQLTIMCSRQTNVTVRWSGPSGGIVDQGTIGAGNRLTIQPPRFPVVNLIQPFSDKSKQTVNQRTFYIEADQPVSVFAFYDDHRPTGSFTTDWAVPPIESYDTSYMGLTYSSSLGQHTGYLLTAAEDGTVVAMNPSKAWDTPTSVPVQPDTIRLDKHQAFQVTSFAFNGPDADLSGTTFSSNKPIGVVTFTRSMNAQSGIHTEITQGPGGPDTIDVNFLWRTSAAADVMPPESRGGTTFYTLPIGPFDSSQVKVIALEDETNVEYNGVQQASIMRGDTHEYSVGEPTKITSNKPILAFMIPRSGNNPLRDTVVRANPNDLDDLDTIDAIYGNPDIAWLPPVEDYKPALQWTNPRPDLRKTFIPGKDSVPIWAWRHYAMITAPVDATSTVELDGDPVDFDFVHNDGQYASTIVPVLPIQHILTSDAPVSCVAFGYGYDDGYAMVSGEALRSIALVDVDSLTETTCDTTVEVFFELSSVGNNNYRIDSITADGIEIRSIRNPIGFPTEMPSGRTLEAHVVLKLPQPRVYTGTIYVHTDANNESVLEIPFRIERDSAELGHPIELDFGQIPVGETSKDTLIQVSNDGDDPLTITSITVDDDRFEILDLDVPFTIPPGGNRSIRVQITPRPGVPERGNIRIVGEPCFTPVDIEAKGFQGAGPLIGITRSVQFPSYLCEAPEPFDTIIVVPSTGDEPVEINSAVLTGADANMFAITDNPAPTTIPAGQSDTFTLRYMPTSFGRHEATLEITTNAVNATDPLTVSLNGSLDTAMILPQRRSIDFGQLLDCDDPADEQVRIINNGTVSTTVTRFELPDGSPFEIVTSSDFDIAPIGGERVVSIRFSPSDDGDFEDTLRILGEPCGLVEEIVLRGSRVTPSMRAENPTVMMDTVYLCEDDATATFTLTNNGPVADTIRRFTQSGDAAFVLSDDQYPIVLEPGESHEFELTFAPGEERDFAGSFEFTWGPCDRSTIVNVEGVAFDPAVSLSLSDLDFGQVDIDAGPVRRTVYIRNESGAIRVIELADLTGDPDFTVVNPGSFPMTISPNDSVALEIEFDPDETGNKTSDAAISIMDPCGEIVNLALSGEGTGTEIIDVRFTISVPDDLSGNVDENVAIPIRLENGSNVSVSEITSLTVYLNWNYSLLLPSEASPGGLTGGAQMNLNEISGDRRRIAVTFNDPQLSDESTLGSISTAVLLGNSPETTIALDSVSIAAPPDRTFTPSLVNGKFTLLGICRLDGDRLVTTGGGLKVVGARPNPVSDLLKLDVEVYDESQISLRLFNANGTVVRESKARPAGTGRYQLTLSVDQVPAGYYYCEIRNAGGRDRTSVIVRR